MKSILKILMLCSLFIGCEKANIVANLKTEVAIGINSFITETPSENNIIIEDTCYQGVRAFNTSIVFIAGVDEGTNTYYKKATRYFKNQNDTVIEGLYSLDAIIKYLNTSEISYTTIHIVSHSNPWRGMSLTLEFSGARITAASLNEAIETKNILKSTFKMSEETKFIFHSCGLGSNTVLLRTLQNALSTNIKPSVFASEYFNVFDGKFAKHYLAKPYYVMYPTSFSPGPLDLSKEIRKEYPNEKIDWFNALHTREETTLGNPYSYRFNIPVTWQFEFESPTVIPLLSSKKELIAYIKKDPQMMESLKELSIPLDRFRWHSKVFKNTLTIYGKTTVLTVLKPLMDSEDFEKYHGLDIEDKTLYTQL